MFTHAPSIVKTLVAVLIVLAPACQGDPPETRTGSDIVPPANVGRITGIARIEPEIRMVDLYAREPGVVERIYFAEGDTVRAGQTIIELDQSTQRAEMARIRARIDEQESLLVTIGVEMEKADADARNLERQLRRLQQAASGGAETPQNVDNAQHDWEMARMERRRLQSTLDNTRAAIRTIQAELEIAAAALEKRHVKALQKGILLRLEVAEGATIATTTQLGTFAPESPMNAVMEVDELFADRVATGQTADIRRQGGSDILATGTVVGIAPDLKQKSLFSDEIGKLEDRRVREVRIRLDQPTNMPLLYGARVECILQIPE